MSNRQHQCLYCYQALTHKEQDFHAACSKKFFGTSTLPLFPFNKNDLDELSNEIILRTSEGTGLHGKLSLDIEKKTPAQPNTCFTIVGLGGHFILKPPATAYQLLPELEDLTMHLASIAQIKTVPHSLIRLQSGELAYISQRTDRTKKGKLPQEDMCQLTGTLTEDKYHGSMERIGKVIQAYSSNPGLDVISFFELALFSFLTGNAHMHLKNFSLLTTQENDISLSPAYDLVATSLVLPDDKEEMALYVNGKKRNLKKIDFDSLAGKLKINPKTLENTYKRFRKNLLPMLAFIDLSFLTKEMKQNYKGLIKQRAGKLFELQDEELIKESLGEIVDKQDKGLVKESDGKLTDQQYTDLVNVTKGEILEKQNEDPFSRQLSLFPI